MSRPVWTFFITEHRDGAYKHLHMHFSQARKDTSRMKAGGRLVYQRSTATDALVISFIATDGWRNSFNELTTVSEWGSMKVISSGITKANARALTRIASTGRHISPTELATLLRAVLIEYDEEAGGHVLADTGAIPRSPQQLELGERANCQNNRHEGC